MDLDKLISQDDEKELKDTHWSTYGLEFPPRKKPGIQLVSRLFREKLRGTHYPHVLSKAVNQFQHLGRLEAVPSKAQIGARCWNSM